MSLKPWIKAVGKKDGNKFIVERYELIKDKADTIRYIVKLYIQGLGTMAIAKRLNQENIPSIARANRRYNSKWKAINIYRMLKHKELIGYYTGTTPNKANFFPPVISEADFYVCQAKLKERRHYKGQRAFVTNLFAHLLKCSKCGSGVTIRNKIDRAYLQCKGNNETTCKTGYIKYQPMESALLSVIGSTSPTVASVGDDNTKANGELISLQTELETIKAKIDTSSKLVADNPSEQGFKIIQQLGASQKEIAARIETLTASIYLKDHRQDWKEVKALLEAQILENVGKPVYHTNELGQKVESKHIGLNYDVIPVSVKKTGGKLEVIRHTGEVSNKRTVELRESLRAYINKIVLDFNKQSAVVNFKSGNSVALELKQTRTYPRKYSFKTVNDAKWTEIAL